MTAEAVKRWGVGSALLVLMLGIFLQPALDGDAFVSTEVVHRSTAPWSVADGAADADTPLHNPFLADHATIYLPWLAHTRAELRAGRFPLWSGESYAGVPYFGNYSVGLLSPFTWAFVLLPFEAAFAIVAGLKWSLAGLGVWLLARRLGLDAAAAWFPALAFAFAGFQVLWINSALTHVSVCAPWCLWAVERARQRPGGGAFALVAITQFLQLVGGHPETSFFVAVCCGLYALLRAPREGGSRIRSWACGLGGMLAGAGLAAVQILPFLEYSGLSDARRRLRAANFDLFEPLIPPLSPLGLGSLALAVGLGVLSWRRGRLAQAAALFLGAVVLRLLGLQASLLQQLLPDLHGNPLDGGSYLGSLTYTDVCGGFVGSATMILALVPLRGARWGSAASSLAICAVVLGARHFRLPLLSQILERTPGFSETGGTRALAAFALVVVVLAGMGWAAARREPGRLRGPLALGLAFALGLATPVEEAAARLLPPSADRGVITEAPTEWRPDAGSWNASQPLRIAGALPAGAGVARLAINGHEVHRFEALVPAADGSRPFHFDWVGSQRVEEGRYEVEIRDGDVVLGASSIDVLRPVVPSWRWLGPLGAGVLLLLLARGRRLAAGASVGWVLLELIVFGARYNDVTPRGGLPAPVEPIAQVRAQMQADQEEGRGPSRILGAGTALQPNLHYLFGLHALRGYDALEPYDYVLSLRYLFKGGVERIWFEQDFDTLALDGALADVLNLRWLLRHGASQSPPDAGWVERFRDGELALYENVDVLPRAFVVQRVHSLAASGPPDPAQFLGGDFLRQHAIRDDGPNQRWEGHSEVRHIDYRSGAIDLNVHSEQGGQLVVSENALPGWTATVDGEEVAVERVNGFMLSLPLSAGEHEVALRYRPASFRRGLAISLGVALVVLLTGGWSLRRRSRG